MKQSLVMTGSERIRDPLERFLSYLDKIVDRENLATLG